MITQLKNKVRYAREILKDWTAPVAGTGNERFTNSICKFMQSRTEIDACKEFLHRNHYVSHAVTCKDWDLALILPELGAGNFLDMGSSDSYVLKNLVRKRLAGERYGIDLRQPDVPVRGVRYVVGDLMDTKLPASFFQNITCLSVVEHEVDFAAFMRETARLLVPTGRLFVTFDYWEPKAVTNHKMYGLAWQPLDRVMAEALVAEAARHGLHLIQEMDWNLNEAVIREGYYSPDPKISYTFGLAVFEKR